MDRLVTVATFGQPIQATLARNLLEAAGLKAFLSDEETVLMAWHFGNAVGGIKLQVAEPDAEQARVVLAEHAAAGLAAAAGTAEGVPNFGDAGPEGEEPEDVPTLRESNADRALRGAVFGLLFLPLQVYAFWLLIQVYVSDEPLRPEYRRHALGAAAINLPTILLGCVVLRWMLAW